MRYNKVILFFLLFHCMVGALPAQSPPEADENAAADAVDLSNLQQQIFRDYERFEKSLYDVAEQARRKDPERAELLYRARSQSQEVNILRDMQAIAELLRPARPDQPGGTQYGPAADREKELIARMEIVLKLLQSLDERERLSAEIQRIQELLKDTNRVIARQKDVRADTQRGKNTDQMQKAQKDVAEDARKLAEKIDGQDQKRREESESSGQSKQNKPSDSEKSPQEPSDDQGQPKDQKDSKSSDPSESEQKDSTDKPSSGSNQEPSPSSPDTPSPDQKSQESGQPQQSSQQPPQNSPSQESPGSQQTPGREELEQARREMQQAIEKLEQQQRDQAVDEQDDAVSKLEKMKAQLEEILRQLREDEKESYLTMLEARFQNMLKRQQRINSETVRLDNIPTEDRAQQSYASQTDTVRKQQLDNANDAEKALHLLREEGSSVVFPEAVEQMHNNMRVVVRRLTSQDTGKTTQLVEQLIVETLEEMIAAFQKELQKKEEQQKSPPGQQGQPQDPSLVDQIAELKMIRSLQNHVNRLTEQIGMELEGKIATDPDQLQLIEDLAQRQKRIQEATYDLSVGRNK